MKHQLKTDRHGVNVWPYASAMLDESSQVKSTSVSLQYWAWNYRSRAVREMPWYCGPSSFLTCTSTTVPSCTECAMNNQATTPLGYCPNIAFLTVCPLCTNARRNRCSFPFGELDETIRCPHTALLHGWRLFNKTWNPITSPWMKQWLRIIHSDLVLHIPSGACQKWWWCGSDGWRCSAPSSSWDFSTSMKQSLPVHRSRGTPTQLVVAVLMITGERRCHSASS